MLLKYFIQPHYCVVFIVVKIMVMSWESARNFWIPDKSRRTATRLVRQYYEKELVDGADMAPKISKGDSNIPRTRQPMVLKSDRADSSELHDFASLYEIETSWFSRSISRISSRT